MTDSELQAINALAHQATSRRLRHGQGRAGHFADTVTQALLTSADVALAHIALPEDMGPGANPSAVGPIRMQRAGGCIGTHAQ